VLGKRRIQYEEELAYDGTNYDAWFSLARLEEDAYRADKEDGEDVEPTRVREVYERAVANTPPATEKRYVRSYHINVSDADLLDFGGDISYVPMS
jgi:crooked neck